MHQVGEGVGHPRPGIIDPVDRGVLPGSPDHQVGHVVHVRQVEQIAPALDQRDDGQPRQAQRDRHEVPVAGAVDQDGPDDDPGQALFLEGADELLRLELGAAIGAGRAQRGVLRRWHGRVPIIYTTGTGVDEAPDPGPLACFQKAAGEVDVDGLVEGRGALRLEGGGGRQVPGGVEQPIHALDGAPDGLLVGGIAADDLRRERPERPSVARGADVSPQRNALGMELFGQPPAQHASRAGDECQRHERSFTLFAIRNIPPPGLGEPMTEETRTADPSPPINPLIPTAVLFVLALDAGESIPRL